MCNEVLLFSGDWNTSASTLGNTSYHVVHGRIVSLLQDKMPAESKSWHNGNQIGTGLRMESTVEDELDHRR